MHLRNAALVLLLPFLLLSNADAVEPLSAQQLHDYCVATDEETDIQSRTLCIAYVTGFLDGAIATDERVTVNIADELENDKSFTERALRTRMVRRMRDSGPTVYAEFCVGNPVPIAEVVQHVIEELAVSDVLERKLAQNVVYASLKKHYPCPSRTGR